MADFLDEVAEPTLDPNGHDVRVVNQRMPVTIGAGSIIFEIALWIVLPILVVIYMFLEGNSTVEKPLLVTIIACLVGMLPGLIFVFMKISAKNYFQQLAQKIQAESSNLDNYLEQRVQILQNVVGLVDRAVNLDSDVMKSVAALRGGTITEENRSAVNQQVTTAFGRLFPQVEAYPELKAHEAIADAMQQNNYLQREITAARTVLNNRITQWNTSIYEWPTKMIVAARMGAKTRIPFYADEETIKQARSKFF